MYLLSQLFIQFCMIERLCD